MARSEIPPAWRQRVCEILRNGLHGKEIQRTNDALRQFELDAVGSFWRDATDAMGEFLSTNKPLGCLARMNSPSGETYEFFFPFKGRNFYGKILLRDNLKSVIVFSAHLPTKPKLRCE